MSSMVDGTLPFSEALEDLYSLTALTWTQPEGCTRYPDHHHAERPYPGAAAGEYDVDAVELADAAVVGGETAEEVA